MFKFEAVVTCRTTCQSSSRWSCVLFCCCVMLWLMFSKCLMFGLGVGGRLKAVADQMGFLSQVNSPVELVRWESRAAALRSQKHVGCRRGTCSWRKWANVARISSEDQDQSVRKRGARCVIEFGSAAGCPGPNRPSITAPLPLRL